MHPSFSDLFVHPQSQKPLVFFGNVEDDKWTNGFLWTHEEHEMFPVIDSIPIFVLPSDRTSYEQDVRKFREGWGPSRAWKTGEVWVKEKFELAEFAKRIAESEGLILDVASGPGGGLAPTVLHINSEATILMDDISLSLLQEWQRVLRDKGVFNVSFALFDATKMPLKSNSLDIIEDVEGFDNIQGGAEAVKEAYRVLKHGGTLFSMNSVIEHEGLLKLPKEMLTKIYEWKSPFFEQGFVKVFEQTGFKIISHTFLKERELSPDEGDLSRESAKYGVKLSIKQYCTELTK